MSIDNQLVIHDIDVFSWGDEVNNIVLAVHFDVKAYLGGDRKEKFCPYGFISTWREKKMS